MAFYAYEKIKNERAKRRRQMEELRRQGFAEGVAETLDAIRTKIRENPDISSEELIESLVADMQNDEDRQINRVHH